MTNLSYKKCLELKNAGFPQFEGKGEALFPKPEDEFERLGLYVPSLEELIEEIGDRLWVLKRGIFMGKDGWIVGQDKENELNPNNWYVFSFGESLKEAVCELYLELKKK